MAEANDTQQPSREAVAPASAGSHIDRLYSMFCIARDSFIKTHFPKPKLRVYLHNPLWHLYDAEEARRELDNALAKYAVNWWKSWGIEITLNRKDGSFAVCENAELSDRHE
jgi:hypothetical protein